MAKGVICPTCGGVISGPIEDGYACHCAVDTASPAPRRAASPAAESPAPSGENSAPSAENASQSKPCAVCGVETTGHRRYRDSRGYICRRCYLSEEDSRRERPGEECEQCGRLVLEHKLVEHEGKQICGQCFHDNRDPDNPKNRFKKVDFSHHRKHTVRNLILVGVFVLWLLLVAVLRYTGLI